MSKNYTTNYSTISTNSIHDSQSFNKAYKNYRKSWEENPKQGRVADFPLNIDLEVTNACNLSCPYCARTKKNWGDNEVGYIDEDIVGKIIDEVNKENGYSMKFSLRGEPLLHDKLVNFLELAKKSKLIDFYFNTNGMLLSKEISRKLVDLQIPRISISVGGWDEKSFNLCQVGADFKTVKTNIQNLKKYRDETDSKYPQIRIQAVLQDDLKPHINEFKNLWSSLADEVGMIDYRKETGEHDYTGVISSSFCCNFLWQRLVVLWDGSVYPCLFHGVKNNKDLYLGNAKENSLKEMWNGEIMNQLRESHKRGLSHNNSCCDSCSYRFLEIKK